MFIKNMQNQSKFVGNIQSLPPTSWTEVPPLTRTLSTTLSSNPKSSRIVDLQFFYKLLFYLHKFYDNFLLLFNNMDEWKYTIMLLKESSSRSRYKKQWRFRYSKVSNLYWTKNFQYRGANLWNELDKETKLLINLTMFKIKLKTNLMMKHWYWLFFMFQIEHKDTVCF